MKTSYSRQNDPLSSQTLTKDFTHDLDSRVGLMNVILTGVGLMNVGLRNVKLMILLKNEILTGLGHMNIGLMSSAHECWAHECHGGHPDRSLAH